MDIFKLLEMVNNPKITNLNNELPNTIKKLKGKLNIKDFCSLHEKDLEIDLSVLLDEEYECDEYIWVVRQCGTHLYSVKMLFAKNSHDYFSFNYYKNYDRAIYKITVTKRDFKNKSVYGEIKLLNTNEFTTKVQNSSADYNSTLCKVITTEGEKIIESIKANESFKDSSLFKDTLKREYNKIKKVYYLKCYNS